MVKTYKTYENLMSRLERDIESDAMMPSDIKSQVKQEIQTLRKAARIIRRFKNEKPGGNLPGDLPDEPSYLDYLMAIQEITDKNDTIAQEKLRWIAEMLMPYSA